MQDPVRTSPFREMLEIDSPPSDVLRTECFRFRTAGSLIQPRCHFGPRGVRLSDEHTLKTALHDFRPGLAAKWIVVLSLWERQTNQVFGIEN